MAATAADLRRASRPAAAWPRRGWACALRRVLQAVVLVPVVRLFCRPLSVRGRERIPDGPVVFMANHASHADTAAIIAALPARARARLAPAAAEDYFFRSRLRGAAVQVIVGAFPFPRSGSDGLARARRLLSQGWSVLVFPEGTRSRDGAIARFRCGAGVLAGLGYPVVPVGIAGTRAVLPPGVGLPRRRPVVVDFGEPEHHDASGPAEHVASLLEGRVRALAGSAARRHVMRRSWHARARALACSRAGLVLAFAWGAAEALAWPVVPDVAVALLAVAAPRCALLIAVAAACGSLAGGAGSYAVGGLAGPGLLDHLPLVTAGMREAVAGWYASDGPGALAHQPWSGVPFKVFGLEAAGHGIGFWDFLWGAVLARVPRILLVGGLFAGFGVATRRWMPRLYGAFAVAFAALFGLGLARVVRAWS